MKASVGENLTQLRQSEIRAVANAIASYLDDFPSATETAEGITRWWLARQRFNDSLEVVEEALDLLEQEGLVERVKYASNLVLYRRSEH